MPEQEFPTMLYRCPGPWDGPPAHGKSTTYGALGVADADALEAAVAAGWHTTLPLAVEAFAAPAPEADPVEPIADPATIGEGADAEEPDDVGVPTRLELETKARQLGVTFTARTTDANLQRKIDDAIILTGG